MTKFEIQAEEILDFLWRSSPVEATFMGIHDRVYQEYMEMPWGG